MALSPAQLAQRRAASAAAAAKRRTKGLSERELTQRRVNAWNQGEANRARVNQRRKEVDRGIRTRILAAGGRFEPSDADQARNSNRLERVWGIPVEVSVTHRFDMVSWDNPALQSFLVKWSHLRAKGMTPTETTAILERRLEKVRRRDQLGGPITMLDLIRENYPISKRIQRRYRPVLTERQRESKRRRDAEYRESKRRRAAA